jgi:hypothetical protein
MEDYNMKAIKDNNGINLEFNNEEALVLFEWISKFNEIDNDLLFQDQAEQRILFDIEALLEKNITQIFDINYIDILSKARAKVRDLK